MKVIRFLAIRKLFKKKIEDTSALSDILFIFAYMLPHWRLLIGALVFSFLLASVEPFLAASMAPLLDEAFIKNDPEAMLWIPLQLIFLFVLKGAFEYLFVVFNSEVSTRSTQDLRSSLFEAYLALPIPVIQRESLGRLMSRILYDVNQAATLFAGFWMTIVKDFFVVAGLMAWLVYLSPVLTLILIGLLPVLGVLVIFIGTKIKAASKRLQLSNAEIFAAGQQALKAIKDIKIFNGFDRQEALFSQKNEAMYASQMQFVKWQSINIPATQVVAAIALGLVILMSSQYVSSGEMSVGELVSYLTAAILIMDPIRRLVSVNAILQKGLAGTRSLRLIFAETKDSNGGLTRLERFEFNCPKPCIRLEEVVFKRRGSAILEDVSCRFDGNRVHVLFGSSGTGKSSLLDLICGFSSPDTGKLFVNNLKVSGDNLRVIREYIALVDQDLYLPNVSVSELLCPSSYTISSDDIRSALVKVGAREFVEQLPQGMATSVGVLGNNLSGGQKQRLALARAILKKPRIFLFDEPTSALDSASAMTIWKMINNLRDSALVIVSTHDTRVLSFPWTIWNIKDRKLVNVSSLDS